MLVTTTVITNIIGYVGGAPVAVTTIADGEDIGETT